MENKCSLSRPAMYCISNFCHLCLKDDKSLIDLSKSVPENDAIKTKLAACVSEVQWVTIKRLLICIACMEKLEWAFDFKQTCIRSYEITTRRLTALKQSTKAKNARKARIHIPLQRETIGPDLTQKYLEQQQQQQRHLGAVRFPTVAAPTGLILTNTGQQGSYQNMFLNFVSTNNMVYPFVTNQPVVINNPTNDDDTILKQLLETKNSEELSVDIDPSLYDFEHFLTAAPTPAPTPNIECSQCGTAYVTIKLLRRHYDEVHGGVLPFVCTFCFSKFLLKDHYDKHMKNHLEKNGDTLMGSTVNLDNLSKGPHQRLLGNIQDHQCRQCPKTYSCSEKLERHIENSHGDAISRTTFFKGSKMARCERCDRDFSTTAYLQKHMKMHEDDMEWSHKRVTAKKNKAQDNKIDLINDSNGLKENINTQFANCVRKKTQNNNASEQGKDEVIEVHDDSPTETGAVDSIRFSDFVVETPDGRISCSVCKKTYARKRDLRRHVNIYHVKSIVYQCHLCDEKFYEGCRLTRHLRWHYTRVSCSECRRTFTSIPEITGHMIDSYNELKGIVCNVCCVTFADVGELKAHTDTHLLELIYKCHLCEERFGECRDLTRHLSEHNGLKSCEHCGKVFDKEEELLKHKNSCGTESYQCDVCPKVFKKKQYLKMHIIAKHADEISVDEPMKKKRKPDEEI